MLHDLPGSRCFPFVSLWYPRLQKQTKCCFYLTLLSRVRAAQQEPLYFFETACKCSARLSLTFYKGSWGFTVMDYLAAAICQSGNTLSAQEILGKNHLWFGKWIVKCRQLSVEKLQQQSRYPTVASSLSLSLTHMCPHNPLWLNTYLWFRADFSPREEGGRDSGRKIYHFLPGNYCRTQSWAAEAVLIPGHLSRAALLFCVH